MYDTMEEKEKAVIVGINIGDNDNLFEELEELKALAYACDINVIYSVTQNLDKINPSLYIGTR